MKLLTIIQARTSSKRLPGKVLLPLPASPSHSPSAGPWQPVLAHVIQRSIKFSDQVVVATSRDSSDDAVCAIAYENGVIPIRGPLHNVLGRFKGALSDKRTIDTEWVCRVTADCPMLSVKFAEELKSIVMLASIGPHGSSRRPEFDMVAPTRDVPRGVGCEIIRTSALAALSGPDEHVTTGLYETCRRVSWSREGQIYGNYELNDWYDYQRLLRGMPDPDA